MITSYFKKHYKIFVGLLLAVMLCILIHVYFDCTVYAQEQNDQEIYYKSTLLNSDKDDIL